MRKYFKKFGHTCDLKGELDLESSLKGIRWVRKVFIKWTTVDPLSNLTLQHFNSHSNVMNERKFHLENHPLAIHPFSRFKFVWECVMVSSLLCGLIYCPLMYLDYVGKDEINVDSLAIITWVKAFCIVDMLTHFFIGYMDEENFVVSAKVSFNCKPSIVKMTNHFGSHFHIQFVKLVPF